MSEEAKPPRAIGVEVSTTVAVEEVSLDLSRTIIAPARELPSLVTLPEPMLRYRCNQQGCCCSGWRIPFRSTDLVRLKTKLAPDDLEKLTHDVEFRVRTDVFGDQVIDEFRLQDDGGHCRFLESDHHRCGLHARYGLEALPDLCIDFPVATFSEEHAAAFFYDPVCPAVLDQIGESDGPVTLVEVDPATLDEGFQHRARRSRGFVDLNVEGRSLGQDRVEAIRSTVLASLAHATVPFWEQLHAIETAFVRLHRTPDEPFHIEPAGDPGAFMRHLGACLGAHGVTALESNLRAYRRFVFAFSLDDDKFPWADLARHLTNWGDNYERFVGPGEDALVPLLRRYVAHAHATPYQAPEGELSRFAGIVTHKLCTSLRYAAALGACLSRPVDRDVMKVALGAGEYFYRSRTIPPDLMPWFDR